MEGCLAYQKHNALLYLIVSCGFGNRGIEEEQCKLDRGAEVEFKPFQDWKVGEVRYCNCSGWIGRAVIR